jgi:hypothetical protein
MRRAFWRAGWFGLAAALLFPLAARAHCDSLDGPVVAAARRALQEGQVTPVLKWVGPQDEKAIADAFAATLRVRSLGPDARALADQSFFETLVRLHRQGEGAPYTGLKPAGTAEPGIVLADQALDGGSADALVAAMERDVEHGIRMRFARVLETRKRSGESVAAGREYVASYVDFIHYVESLREATRGAEPDHGTHEAPTGHPEKSR